jgi:cytochrome c biogenesis protein CcdA/thiol-disulfide isomerase/thioredoxin
MKRILLLAMPILALLYPYVYAQRDLGGGKIGGFSAGPYLLDVTTESAVVAFHLDTPLAAKVRISDGNETREFKSEEASKSHFVKVTGLKPGLTYDYEVICGDGQVRTPEGDQSFQIRTACRPGESFTFAVYGDTRPSENKTTRYHQEVINQVVLNEPQFCLVLGDMVDEGARADLWAEFFGVESKLLRRTAIYPVLGDNDFANGKGLYADFFPKLEKGYYKFEWGGVEFFGLRAWGTRGDQGRAEIDADSPQIKWLESELAKEEVQKAPFRVIFLHDPVYISRGRASEVLRRVWVPLFQKYKVDVVFASWHLYERSVNDEITYIISGGAGAELIWMNKDPAYPSQADAREYHFCKVDINSNAMTISAIGTDGTVFDSVTLVPRSHEPDVASQIERAAKRLGKEILINTSADSPVIPLYFFSSDCEYCRQLLNHELPRLANENNISLAVFYYDLGVEGTYDLFLNAEAEFGRQGAEIPAIFIGRSVFGGESEIQQSLPIELANFRKNPQSYLEQMITPFTSEHDTTTIKEETFSKLTYGIVLGAGLLDGVNPCAFTTVIFLISYLSLVGGTRRQMLYTGGMFTLAVFIAYLAIGLAFFNFARLLLRDPTLAIIVNSVLLLVVGAFAIFSVIDFVRCLKGSVSDITLQLPGFLKESIRERIRSFARNKMAMAGASFALGVVIAGMELVCTGQVYFPIVTMISEPRHRMVATTYLFSYNLAFIVPLVIVFLLATFGVTSERMGTIFRRHVAMVKLGLAVLFAAMAVMIILNLRWL